MPRMSGLIFKHLLEFIYTDEVTLGSTHSSHISIFSNISLLMKASHIPSQDRPVVGRVARLYGLRRLDSLCGGGAVPISTISHHLASVLGSGLMDPDCIFTFNGPQGHHLPHLNLTLELNPDPHMIIW